MAKISEVELQKRLRKLESEPVASTALVSRVGDQYEYDKDFVYIAYASALASLSAGAITNQSDATDFQFSPYNASGTLMAYRGYFINKSIYQSGDPTDYFWESTSGTAGFTSSERHYTTSTGLQESLGNPTKPGTNITWTVISAGTAVPSTAVYVAERFTITTTAGAITSEWKIKTVGKHIDSTVVATGAITSEAVTADAITVDKIDLNGTLAVTAASGAIRWNKADGDDTTNAGLFMGNNSSGSPRFVIGSTNSFIYFNGATGVVSAVGVSESATVGNEETFYTSGTSIFTISPLIDEINLQMIGGGGGGEKSGTVDGGAAATNGGDTIVKVITNIGTTRATYTSAGGPKAGPNGVGGSFAAGENGDSFVHPGGSVHSSFAGTGGAGGAYNTGAAGGNGGTGAGGGGMSQAGGGSAAHGGEGGEDATFYTTTLTTAASHFVSTDHLEITVGAGGLGRWTQRDGRGGGDGGGGRVRIKGELA